MSVETFIFCHNQEIILNLLRAEKYKDIGDFKFIFMGPGAVEKLDKDKVIIAREMTHNIEQYRNCLQYCGWYAIYKNNLCNAEKIRLIDYDVDILKWDTTKQTQVKSFLNYDFSFYYDEGYGECAKRFRENIFKKTGYSAKEIAANFKNKTNITNWFSAADVLTDTSVFVSFMEWVEYFFFLDKEDPCFSFHFERYFCIFCMINDIPYQCVNNETTHLQLQSHPFYNHTNR